MEEIRKSAKTVEAAVEAAIDRAKSVVASKGMYLDSSVIAHPDEQICKSILQVFDSSDELECLCDRSSDIGAEIRTRGVI